MKILVLLFIEMTWAFPAESRQGDRTQGLQTVLETARSAVVMCIATQGDRCGLLCITPCACAKVTKEARGTHSAMHRCHTNKFSDVL
jgi:hypothetical protein